MALVELIGAVCSAGSLIIACVLVAYGRRLAIANLAAHLDIVRHWAAGYDGSGWHEDRIRPIDRLKWISPQWSVIQNFSGNMIRQLGVLGSIGLTPELAPHLASVAQSLGSLNSAVARCEAWKVADPGTYLRVRNKLNVGVKAVLGHDRMPPDDLTQEQLGEIMNAAKLTDEEWEWAGELASMLQSLHVSYIGTRGTPGLHHHLAELEDAFRRHYS